MTVDPVPPSYGRRRKSDRGSSAKGTVSGAAASGRRRKRKRSPEKKSGRRRRSDGGEAADRAGGTEPIDLEGVTLRPPEVAASGRRRRSAPINLKGVTLRTDSGAVVDDDNIAGASSKDTRDDDDSKDSKEIVDPSANKRYAAVADQSYEDNRKKEYPSLKDATFDPVLSDERNVVYHDKNDGSTWWGIRGTDFSSPKDLATDAAIVGEHVGGKRYAELKKLFTISPNMKLALPVAELLSKKSRDDRFDNTESKYQQIRKKYKKGIINIGAHSLGGAVAQHLLKSLTPNQEKGVRVHAFNALPLPGFDPEKHLATYYETKNRGDPVSVHAVGSNVRTVKGEGVKVVDGVVKVHLGGGGPESSHAMRQFVGLDLNKIPRGRTVSVWNNMQNDRRGDDAERQDIDALKAEHRRTREKIRKQFIKGLRLKTRVSLERKREKSKANIKDEL